MKLLILCSEYPPAKVYGLGRFVHGLARALAAAGDEVHVLTNSTGGTEDDLVLDGVHVHRIAFPNPPRPPDGHGEVLQFNHGLVARFLDRVERFRNVDVVVGHDWLTAIAAREIAAELGRPLVTTFHDEIVGKRFGVLRADDRFVRDLEALAAHDAARVIANSDYIAREVVRHYGVPVARVRTVHGGIDPAVVAVAAEHRVADFRSAFADADEVLVGYVGRFDAEKGLDVLAEAAVEAGRAEPRLRFALAGSGALEGQVRDALAPLGGRARLLGYLKGETLAYFYRACDVVAVPSVYEPLGLVPLEAMLGGAAVVVSTAGGLPEIVRDGQDGLVVSAGDPRTLARALVRLARDASLRGRLRRAGAERARADFSWAAIASRTQVVYAEAAREPRPVLTVAPSPPERPLVSVTIATHNAPVHLETALRSLFGRTAYGPMEAIVVDNGSTRAAVARVEAVVRELQARGAVITLVRNETNRFFSVAQNQAIALARGEYACTLNDDTEIPPGSERWLEALVWQLEQPGVGTVTPVTLTRGGRIYCAGAFGSEGHRLGNVPDGPGVASAPRRTEWNNMACLLTRRRYFQAVGGLCEDSPYDQREADREWGLRLSKRLGLAHWVHPIRLFHFEKEAQRDPTVAFGVTPDTRLPASIVIVAYNNLRLNRECVDSVLAGTEPPFELVIVDNGSTDGSREYFRSVRDQIGGRIAVQLIENAENAGYTVGANQGARAARGRHVVLLNNDTRVRPGWLRALLDAAASSPRAGVVTAKILNLDGTVQNAGGILHAPDGSYTVPHANEDRLAPPIQNRTEVENAGGPCMLLTRALLEKVGLFDEVFNPAYFEDSDLCFRARKAGLQLVYEPAAEVIHHGKATSAIVASEGKGHIWRRFEVNKALFHTRWSARLAEDDAARRSRSAEPPPERRRIVLCYHRSNTTTAAYCEAALRRGHEVVTAGRGQDLDLGEAASAADLVAAAGGDVDLLLVVEGENYFPRGLRETPCPTAFWAIDNHWHAASDEGYHFARAREFQQVFIAQRDYLDAFRSRGIHAGWLPLACDPDVHGERPAPRDLDVVFVGHVRPFHQRRRRLLDRLKQKFSVTEVHGVFREEMARLFSQAKIVFNCSLFGDLNMRVFEGLASGGLLVTDRIGNGLDGFFADGEHLALYEERTVEEVVERYLADHGRRESIAARGRRLVLGHHTYAHRMRELLATVASGVPTRLGLAATR